MERHRKVMGEIDQVILTFEHSEGFRHLSPRRDLMLALYLGYQEFNIIANYMDSTWGTMPGASIDETACADLRYKDYRVMVCPMTSHIAVGLMAKASNRSLPGEERMIRADRRKRDRKRRAIK